MNYVGWIFKCFVNFIFQGEPGPKGEKVESCVKCIKIVANFRIICEDDK